MTLYEWRKMMGYTLEQAANFLGISNLRTYQRYEKGEREPDAATRHKIVTRAPFVTRDDIDATIIKKRYQIIEHCIGNMKRKQEEVRL